MESKENMESTSTGRTGWIWDNLLNPFRDFLRTAIRETVESVPELKNNDQWWQDIQTYDSQMDDNSRRILGKQGTKPTYDFDYSGVVKWMTRLYLEPENAPLNRYLCDRRRAVHVKIKPGEYAHGLHAFVQLRNKVAHEDAEALDDETLYNFTGLLIWLTDNLTCSRQQQTREKLEAARQKMADTLKEQGGEVSPAVDNVEASAQASLLWAEEQLRDRGPAPARRSRTAFEFEEWPVVDPVFFAPWEELLSAEAVLPSGLAAGKPLPRSYTPAVPRLPNQPQGRETERPEVDYAAHQKSSGGTAQGTAPKAAPADDIENDIIFKMMVSVVQIFRALAMLYYALFTGAVSGLFGIDRRDRGSKDAPKNDYSLDRHQTFAANSLLRGAVYDIRHKVDEPWFGLSIVTSIAGFGGLNLLHLIGILLRLPFLEVVEPLFMLVMILVNLPLGLVLLMRLRKRYRVSKAEYEGLNKMGDGLAPALCYFNSLEGRGIPYVIFMVFCVIGFFPVSVFCPFMLQPALAMCATAAMAFLKS